MNTILLRQYQETRSKYLKFSSRLEKSKKTGQFYRYSARKQHWLINRIKKLWEKLRFFEKQLKFAVAAGTLSLAMGLANPSFAQPNFVEAPGKNPFPPPMVYGQSPIFKDLDLDGDLDILVTHGDAEIVFFRNIGTATVPAFQMVPKDQNPYIFPEEEDIETWNIDAVVDIDGDGDLDIFTDDSGFKLFQNTGSASEPVFEETESPIASLNYNQDLADFDGDGDYDLVKFDNQQTYNDVTQEWEYTPQVEVFINVGTAQSADIDRDNPVYYTVDNLPEDISYIDEVFPIDYEGDGDIDFLAQLEFYDEVLDDDTDEYHVIENTGSVSAPQFTVMDEASDPFTDLDIGWNDIYPVDIDDDGDVDAIITYNYIGFNLYRNTGVGLIMDNSITEFQGVVLGISYIKPGFIDFDGDGDMDMYTYPYDEEPGVYYENTGNAQSPQFTPQQEYFPFLSDLTEEYYFPMFADLDSDGDLDALIYNYDYYDYSGILYHYYKNNGTGQSPDYQLDAAADFLPDLEDMSTFPAFVDIDNDGDLDMFWTIEVDNDDEDESKIMFYRNTGSQDDISFTLQEGTDYPFNQDLFIGEIYYNPLVFADVDKDGDYDLFFSDYYGKMFHFENTGTAETPFFVDKTDVSPIRNITAGYAGGFSLVDLDGDGDLDLFVTSLYNTIASYYENTDVGSSTGISPTLQKGSLQVYPNPASEYCRLQLDSPYEGLCSLQLIDGNGRLVLSERFRKASGVMEHELNTSGLKPGLYLLKVNAGNTQQTSRLMIR